MKNKKYCSELACTYKTNSKTSEEDKNKLNKTGYDINKTTMCPKCFKDSLVFIN